MKKLFEKSPAGVILSFFAVIMVLTIVVDSVFSIIFADDNVAQLVARFVLIVIMLLVNVTVFKLKFGNMMNRIGLGLLLLLPGLSYVVLNLIGVEFDNLMKASMQAYLIAVVSTIAAVSYEEILLRGLLLNGLLKAWSQKKNGILLAVIWSSVLFSLVHAINLLSGAPLDATLLQLIYTTAMGFLFAAVYLRTNNLLIPIIGHFVINFSGVLQDMGIDPEKVTGHVSAGDDVRKALIAIAVASGIVFVFAMIYLRKKKLAEVNDLNLNIK
ncbi:TPA: CPBP family intramembrane metalloprotease [Bacillus cereus]|uniref:CPBP family intramembrane glutamic endopeptidase n=1 Tax=Bacillus cereus TaxID=1396 RepID=UPI0009950A6C|nr:CPBP family intramembrane glutamic endopeptidase [Bacillus cereus]OPA37359.1 CAAX protease family protein [Bacillus cereus]HDR3347235.1 CPBP family intramembrane metalloprotease [Bacillus cereus]